MSFSLSAHLRLIPLLSLAGVAPASAAVDFEKQVLPIIDAKCMDCHKAPYEDNGRLKKPKAELRLDAAWAILHGSENGKVLKPGDSKGSYLYEVTTLPEDDDMFMPPKGDPLTAEEKKLLKEWIDEGAKFGGWKGTKEKGKQRLEGKDYVMQPDDVVEFMIGA